MVEITDSKEYRRVMSEETVHVVRMAMRYEHTPKTTVDAERCKCRWIVRGDQEPAEWFEELDSPTIMASTTKMPIASGSLTSEDDVALAPPDRPLPAPRGTTGMLCSLA